MPPHARWEKLLVENTEMDVFVDEPIAPGPHPAIVVAHHRAGNDVATTKFVQDLAGCGYVAASPHLHHRRPKGEDTRDSIANLDDNQKTAPADRGGRPCAPSHLHGRAAARGAPPQARSKLPPVAPSGNLAACCASCPGGRI